ncbi:hypothetical protein [Streptomyces albus]|uniref:hypothetical protein n=1 Tax=Streptomyces albus TaxID=1888 RepID=UPI0004CA5822|nr:hypothetical protein [Streptomyces albus]
MRIISRLLATTALTAIALGGAATASQADGHPDSRMRISPHMPKAGSHVVISVKSGCEDRRMTAKSFGLAHEVTLHRQGHRSFAGSGKVKADAKPGRTYWVRAHCRSSGDAVVGHFTVGHHAWRGSHAGEGGSSGGNAGTAVAGTGLVALAAGGSVLALRRRRDDTA